LHGAAPAGSEVSEDGKRPALSAPRIDLCFIARDYPSLSAGKPSDSTEIAVPRIVRVVDALPLLGAGKID